MTIWLNHVAILTPRNATTTHTVDPSTGTVAAGVLFTPTAGNLLVCAVEGAVTSTTPTGWTLPANGSAINNSGLYVWYRTAAGADSFSTTHNGSNYPVVFDFYEFSSGSTFGTAASATGVVSAPGGAGPTLSGLTGTNLIFAVAGQGQASGSVAPAGAVWSAGTEVVDTSVVYATTDGYLFSVAYLEDSALTSWSSACTFTNSGGNEERLVFAVKAAGAAGYPFPVLTPTPRYNPASTAVYG